MATMATMDTIDRPRVILSVLALLLVAVPSPAQDCSVVGQNTFVRERLDEFYLWYRELPEADPALFDSPEAYLDRVRFRPIDNRFSYITSRAASTAFYSASQSVGIGFTARQLQPGELRIAQVFPESAADEAGLRRGDYLLAIDGRPVSELLASGELGAALGPSEPGYTLELTWRSIAGDELTATVVKRPYTIPTVSHSAVFDNDGLPVGYVHLRNFVEPSTPALRRVFTEFHEQGVDDVILDVRYNGGGLIDVARYLGSLIGGVHTNTRVFVEFIHNDKQSFRNRALRFEDLAAAIDVPRLVVITSQSSASASELVINALEPFIPVTLVGRRTFGKPVGQYGFEFCDKVLFPVSFLGVNAEGDGEYYDGLPVDCPMRDGLNRPLGNPEEARLAEALYFLRNGTCSPESAQTLRSQRVVPEPGFIELRGFEQLVNAW